MCAIKTVCLQALKPLLIWVFLYAGLQSTAYAACAPSATPSSVSRGQNITFTANCDASERSTYQWTVFGQVYNTTPNPDLTLTVPANVGGTVTAVIATELSPLGYSVNFAVNGGTTGTPAQPLLITPSALSFVDTKIGFGVRQQIAITNSGTQSVGINGFNLQGANTGDFFIQANSCPILLAPSSTCGVSVLFRPIAIGGRSAEVVVLTDQASNPIVSVSGAGVDPKVTVAATTLAASPSPLVLPFTTIGQTSQRIVTLTNNGTTDLRVDSSSVGGLNFSEFVLRDTCEDVVLAPTVSCTLEVTFLPKVAGVRAGLLLVNAEGPDKIVKPYLEIAFTGEAAITGPSSLVATPASLSFGQKKIAESTSLQINLVNNLTVTGNQNLSLSIKGDDFTQTNDCIGPLGSRPKSTLQPGNKNAANAESTVSVSRQREALTGCTVTVTFIPTVLGLRNATLSVRDNQGNQLNVAITGGATGGLTDAQIKQIATQQITANLQSMELGLRTQLSNINKRLSYLRFQEAMPAFRQDIDVGLNGRSMPLSGGGCGSSGTDKASTKTREECEEDFKKTNSGRWGSYITGSVSVNENTLSGVKINSNGITLGGDYRLSGKSALGIAFGAMKSNTEMAGDAGKQDASGYSLVGYGSFAPSQASFIDFALTAGSGKFDLKRLETGGTTAVADTSGNGIGFSLSAGLDWRDYAWAITPYVRAEYLHSKVKGFSERGTSPIQVGNQSLTSSMFTVGTEAQYTVSTSWGIFIPHARIEMQKQSQSSPDATAQAVGSGVQLTVSPDLNKDKSYGNAGFGASAQFAKGKTGFLDFDKTFGKENFRDQRFSGGVKIEF